MKSKMALSSMCRACAHPSTPISSTRTLIPLSASSYSQRATASHQAIKQTSRSLSTTTIKQAEASPNTTPEPSSSFTSITTTKTTYTPIPPTTPSNLTPPQLLSLPTLHPSYPTPSFTATITSIHTHTAHATRTISSYNTHLRKSFLTSTSDLVHDPYSLLRVGDVIRYTPFTPSETAAREQVKTGLDEKRMGRLKAKRRLIGRPRASDAKRSARTGVRFVVRQVVSAFGEGLEERMARGVVASQGAVGEGKGKRKGEAEVKEESIVAEVQRREGLLGGGAEAGKVVA